MMATGGLRTNYYGADILNEAEEEHKEGAEAAALHDRLVAYVNALSGHYDGRYGVWGEHSYARTRGAAPPPAGNVRVLLAPRAAPPAERVDVERPDASPPPPPERDAPDSDRDTDDEPDWEQRVLAMAPAAAHARLADAALDALRRLRLQRLAARPRREAARGAARRLRLALAAAAAPGPPAQRPAPWLHATLMAYMPRRYRRLYEEAVVELRRTAPRAAERLTGAPAPAPPPDPLAAVGPPVGPEASPWLVWVSCGRARSDARWCRRLRALVHTRLVSAPRAGPASPEAWCAGVAGGVRAALADVLAEAGQRAVFVGGFGAGAALAAGAAAGAGGALRGALLLAPALATAEGAPGAGLRALRLPLLLVAGAGARGAARALCRREARRVLELRGADDALRLPRAERLRRRLPQHALDAAIAEECARWVLETAEAEPPGARRATSDDEEYAHLPAAGPPAPARPPAGPPAPARPPAGPPAPPEPPVVSRGPAATPLALLPPRRREPPLGAADIMRLPIVFADDAPPELGVTVTSAPGRGAGVTRVLVASRPVLLRRGVRLLPRDRS